MFSLRFFLVDAVYSWVNCVYVFVVVREYDVPYHVRVSIDLKITVSRWYSIVIGGTAVTPDIQLREDLLDLPVCLMLCSVFCVMVFNVLETCCRFPLELHLTTSELWFGQEQEGILP